MRFTNRTWKKPIGLLSVIVMLIGMMTASAVQASAASAGVVDVSVRETAKALINGYVSDTLLGVLIFIIILLVLALVAVVVVILVITNKKKENDNFTSNTMQSLNNAQSFQQVQPMNRPMDQPMNRPMGQPMNRPIHQPMGQPVSQPMSRPQAPENFFQNNPAENMQFPADGAGDTTALGLNSDGFILMRKNGSEKITINKPEFYIGKERAKVDYCITNNNSVSRRHAKIKVRAGKCYISDLGSTNCTYINGTKLSPNQEVALIPGDKVKLSNEEFEYIG